MSFIVLILAVLAIYIAYSDSKTMAKIKKVIKQFEPSADETVELLNVNAENPQKPLTLMDAITKLLENSNKQLTTSNNQLTALNTISVTLEKQTTNITDLHLEKFPKGVVPDEIRRRNPISYNNS